MDNNLQKRISNFHKSISSKSLSNQAKSEMLNEREGFRLKLRKEKLVKFFDRKRFVEYKSSFEIDPASLPISQEIAQNFELNPLVQAF